MQVFRPNTHQPPERSPGLLGAQATFNRSPGRNDKPNVDASLTLPSASPGVATSMAATAMESIGISVSSPHTQARQPVLATDNLPAPTPEDIHHHPTVQLQSAGAAEKVPTTKINQNIVFWEAYNRAGDDDDKEFVKTSGNDLDALLIFAGLFSATNTAFIIESYKNLKPDPTEETNNLLRSLFSAIIDPANATPNKTSFTASPQAIRVNAFFFASLCCSLCAAFGAVLVKQWLTQYDRDGGESLKSPATRGRERQRKSEGRGKWHLEDVIVTLPTLLQFSLFFFFIGLVDLLRPLNDIVMSIILGFTITTFLFYIITMVIAAFDKSAPFQTRLSLLLHSPIRRILDFFKESFTRRPGNTNAEAEPNVDISCFTYLFERMVEREHIGVFAEAVVSLWDRLDKVAITNRFIDTYLKPTIGQVYSLPRLYGPHRPSLLKILAVLVKDWSNQRTRGLETPSHPSIDIAKFCNAIHLALPIAFAADPADSEALQYISGILFNLQHLNHPLPSPGLRDTEVMNLWLRDDVTKNLQHADFVTQRNTLKLLVLVASSASPGDQIVAGDVVHRASASNPALGKLTELASLRELWGRLPVPDEPGILVALPLFSWIVTGELPEDIGELADMVEALPFGSGKVERGVAESFLGRVIETLLATHLEPTFDGWWRLPGLQGQNKRPLLRIIHVVIVKWRFLEAGLDITAPSYQLLHPLVSSLRAELWEAFLAAPKDSEEISMISKICENLPTPLSVDSDDISMTARLKVSVDISGILQGGQAEPTVLQNYLSFLGSNADLFLSLAEFLVTPSTPETHLAIPNHLRSTMWDGETADLEDFWRATFRVQLLPMCFPDELHALRFPEYLHLWLQRYHYEERRNERRRLPMCWAYLLSLERILSTTEGLELAKELKAHGHQSHLLDIYHRYNYDEHDTCPLLALKLFLCLWSYDTSDVRVEHVGRVLVVLRRVKFSLPKITADYNLYARSSRIGYLSDEGWGLDISSQVGRDMGQMLKLLYSYLKAAVQCGLVTSAHLDDRALNSYSAWCNELDKQLGLDEYGQLAERLRGLVVPVVETGL